MDRRDERRWKEKVPVETVRIAWVWNDGSSGGQKTVFTQERPRDREPSPGRDIYWGKERIIYERGFGEERVKWEDRSGRERKDWSEERLPWEDTTGGEERPRGVERPHDQERFPKEKAGAEGQAGAEEKPGREKGFKEKGCDEQEGQVAQDPGRGTSQVQGGGQERKGREDPIYFKTWRLSQDQGRGPERRQSVDPNYCNTRGLSQDQGRGPERRQSVYPNYCNTWGLSQDQGRGPERRQSVDPNYCNTRGLSQDQGRGLERKWSEDPNYCNTWGLSQDQGRGPERKRSEGPNYCNTRGLSQDQGRGPERKRSEGPNYCNTRGLSQDQGRGPERKWSEGPNYCNTWGLSQDQGRGPERRQSVDPNYCNTRGLSQDQGRGPERRQSVDPNYCNTRGLSQDQGRGPERKWSEGPNYCNTRGLSQDQGRGPERKWSEGPNYCNTWGLSQDQGRGPERKWSEGPNYCNTRGLSQDQGRGPERKWSEGPNYCNTRGLSQDQGRGPERRQSVDPNYCNTWGLSQDQGRGPERRQSVDPNYCNTWGLSQDQGRGQERRQSVDPNYCNTWGLSQDQGRGQERRQSKDSNYDNTRGLNQDQGRRQERRQSEDLLYRNTSNLNQNQGRGQERKWSEDLISKKSQSLGQGKGPSEYAGSSYTVSCPAMSPVSPVWPRKPNLWVFWVLRLVLLLSLKTWAMEDVLQHCTWRLVLNKFSKVGLHLSKDRFHDQEPIDAVSEVFHKLTDSPVDPEEKYLSFPYYLQINFTCPGQSSEELARKGHLMGMKPLVLINYMHSVNFYQWKMENLQVLMEAAPMRSTGYCLAEAMCVLNWYTPMPVRNGSVVSSVDIYTNGIGPFIPKKRFYVNMNGFLTRDASGKAIFTIGYESLVLKSAYFKSVGSRPLWYTVNHAPVLILGGFDNEKAILLSDSNFQDYVFLELSIDSCWVGSFYCPTLGFSATIHDAIATESTLFIRQNQLVYYYTGAYSTLYDKNRRSRSWVRVLPSECIKKLCPVFVSGNGSEYILALTTGKNEGYIHIGTITEGLVSFQMVPEDWSVCQKLPGNNCTIDWATYIADERNLLLLVKIVTGQFYLVNFNLEFKTLKILYEIPKFIPEGQQMDFLVLLGTETYTTTPMKPKGLYFNTLNNMLYIWGNFILQSYDREHFIFLVDFPKESTIKYMINSYNGHMAAVTENEEIWYFLEGGYDVYKVVPSQGWTTYINLQKMQDSPDYSNVESLVSLFYQDGKLYELVYLFDVGKECLVKRLLPVGTLMEYDLPKPFSVLNRGDHKLISFTHICPFKEVHIVDVPKKQHMARKESYLALPPLVSESLGIHNNNTLAVYQGLVYYLLWLHAKYDKPYADPVHDPTWRWWQHKTKYKDYYFYLFSNRLAAEGMYIDMDAYQKLYNISGDYGMPDLVFLDKGNWFSFTLVLLSHEDTFTSADSQGATIDVDKKLAVALVMSDPECLSGTVTQEVLLNRNAVLNKIKVRDEKRCSEQGMVGHNIKKTSMLIKILGASGRCLLTTYLGAEVQGFLMVPIFIGCPPGKRLAFDVSYTIMHSEQINKHYFDCVTKEAEMPCFLFRDIFQPFFLVQDMVTGDSGSFLGSYVLKVVGGGQTKETIRDYTEEEIFRYNSPLDTTNSLIWKTKLERTTEDKKFYIMSYQSPGIEWLCLENSPCYDITPQSIFPPEFFLKLLVSNRGVDNSTYCDYQLTFILHIHGLPLSSKRSFQVVVVSSTLFIILVVIYILFCILWPHIVKAWDTLRWRMKNMMASESYYTYATSTAGFSIQSHSSVESFKGPSRAGSKEDHVQAKKA
ncbi:cation channel sperm-associated auxiliary subunit gamma isoform X3 [Arvicanthis niloticus]|uniref:cation channel sperm-associated auxiliary subunit gamma isoform X3 n=1 Tax=Arvicanthis niloticus TaxID=61156 RepID=UPI00402BAB32